MKAKYALITLLAVTFFGCDDNTAGLGLGMFPGSDQDINGKLSTFEVTTKSIAAGDIYAKTNVGYVGKFTDAIFGTYEAGFLATLNCPANLTFPAAYDPATGKGSMVTDFSNVGLDEETIKRYHVVYETDSDGKILEPRKAIGNCRIDLSFWYNSYFGDSLTACRMSVYELNKILDDTNDPKVYYTDIVPEDYYNKSDLLGTKAYTAVDMSLSDSLRNSDSYHPNVSLSFSQDITRKIGGKILTYSKDKGEKFSDFFIKNVFNGIYVKSDYGDGTILYISDTQMSVISICYAFDENGKVLKSSKYEGKDSVVYSRRSFTATREVIQANQLKNDKPAIDKCINEDNFTYLKSPAGIFTEATLPIEKIKNDLAGDTLNAVRLAFPKYNQPTDTKFGMSAPNEVLLIRKRYKDSFFVNNQLADDVNSYLLQRSQTLNRNQYIFNNITKLINICNSDKEAAEKKFAKNESITFEDIKDENGTPVTVNNIEDWKKATEWNKVVLIPVLVGTDSSGSDYYGNSNVISIKHDLKPSYVKLKGGSAGENNEANRLKLEVVSTSFVPTK